MFHTVRIVGTEFDVHRAGLEIYDRFGYGKEQRGYNFS